MPAQQVQNVNIPPNTAVGYLAMQWSDGSWAYGSASMLDDRNLLTCSHNLVDQITEPPPRGYAIQVLFYPGYNQQSDVNPPPGGLQVGLGLYSNNFAAGQDAWDVAVLRLAEPVEVPPAYYFTPVVSGNELVGENAFITGYPGPANGQMWEDRDDEVAGVHIPTNTLLYTLDTWPGNSGSPIWTYDAVQDTVSQHAVHVSRQAQELRRGVLITQTIRGWIDAALEVEDPEGAGFHLLGG